MALDRLTPHQAEVFGRIARQCQGSQPWAYSVNIRSEGAVAKLLRKGYVEIVKTITGPRGGKKYHYGLTEAGQAYFDAHPDLHPKPTRYSGKICYCGKTVLTPGVTCPRDCEQDRPKVGA